MADRSRLAARCGQALLWIARRPAWLAIAGVRFYQRGLSPLIGPRCRYSPSCSEYTILAIKKYGLIRGGLRGAWRIARCNPFSLGGYDPP
ncbi:MAG: membrane protein insertion efficiency factor YidD [Aureliella sp.]